MYRYEKKFLINKLQMILLKSKLSAIMELDSNVKNEDGSYFIRSLYFDSYSNDSYYQVLNGLSKREKYRIRFYDYDKSYITLEKKFKINNLGTKYKSIINEQIVNYFINNISFETNEELVNELKYKVYTNLYKPVVIIDYYRLAFIYPINDVRITIDYNVSCSNEIEKLFEKNINSIPILERNMAILEVKYNEFLPNILKYAINEKELEITSFSKYSNGRAILEKIEGSV